MQFLVIGKDGKDNKAVERRLAVREAHLLLGDQMEASGKRWYGCVLKDDKGKMIGSMAILDFLSEEELKKEISSFERMLANIGSVNLRALDIYDTAEQEYKTLQEKKKVLSVEKEDVLKLMAEIETTKKDVFLKSFVSVQEHFSRIFGQLSHKGQLAQLELESPEVIFDQGMNIKVRLTGEKFLDIRSLSGGEKTLTALAFL